MAADLTYANCFTALWSLMTYSAGMPILYPIGFLTFFIFAILSIVIAKDIIFVIFKTVGKTLYKYFSALMLQNVIIERNDEVYLSYNVYSQIRTGWLDSYYLKI